MYKSYSSQKLINQGARVHMCVSAAYRLGCTWSINGTRVPMRALKSPQTNVVSWGCMASMTSARRVVAWVSDMSRRAREEVGGKYTFTTLRRWLFGSTILVSRPYSLPSWFSIWNDWRMNVAMPPRVPVCLRHSTTRYPGRSGIIAPSANHVS